MPQPDTYGLTLVCQDRGYVHLDPPPAPGQPRPACVLTSQWTDISVILNQGVSASYHQSAPWYQCVLVAGRVARRNATDRRVWDAINTGGSYFGSIAVLEEGKVFVLPATNQFPYLISNDGATVTPCTVNGAAPTLISGESGWGWHGVNGPLREACCNDPDVPGVAYAYNYKGALAGLYEATNGIDLVRVSAASNIIDGVAAGYAAELKMGGGVMYLIAGYSGSGAMPQNNSVVGMRSFDKGRTWSAWGQGTQVVTMAIGAPMPWSSNKTIYALMYIGSTFGLWFSTDNATSFTALPGVPPIPFMPNKIIAHPALPGKITVSVPGFGWYEGEADLALGLR